MGGGNGFRIDFLHQPSNGLRTIFFYAEDTRQWMEKLKETLKELGSSSKSLGKASVNDLGERVGIQLKESLEERTLYRVLFARSNSIIDTKYIENAPLSLLAIGETCIYLITNDKVSTYGLLIIKKIIFDGHDNDTARLILQSPLEPAYSILISSVCSELIIADIRQAVATLTPFYAISIEGKAVHVQQQDIQPAPAYMRCDESFRTLLKAYCDALSIDHSRIVIHTSPRNIDPAGLQITVCSPKNHAKDPYSAKELFAIFRSLRYNTSIIEISFKSVDLSNLEVVDDNIRNVQENQNGMDLFLNVGATMLTSELYHLITTNNYLIKLDLTDCNIKANNVRLGALAAIGLAINTGKTGLEMLYLGGNVITEPDRLVIEQGIREKEQAIKELDISSPSPQNRSQVDSENPMMREECVSKMIQVLLDVVPDILEYLNLSNNELSSNVATALAEFNALRTFKMANMKCTTAFDLTRISSNVLEELELSGTPLTPNTIDVLSSFIRESSSDYLKTLSIENCKVNSEDFAKICSAISESQKLHIKLNVGNNPLLTNFNVFIDTFRQNKTPARLSIDFITWERRRLVTLFDDLRHNISLKSLSIAKPIFRNASGNVQAMNGVVLQAMNDTVAQAISEFLAKNTTLEELNISGDGKNIYGDTLTIAFEGLPHCEGLKSNTNLKIINVSGNNLGKTGILSFSKAISENKSLKGISIDDNQVSYLILHVDSFRST